MKHESFLQRGSIPEKENSDKNEKTSSNISKGMRLGATGLAMMTLAQSADLESMDGRP